MLSKRLPKYEADSANKKARKIRALSMQPKVKICSDSANGITSPYITAPIVQLLRYKKLTYKEDGGKSIALP